MPIGTVATVELLARLALLGFSSLQRILAEKAALEGKTEGTILREALKGVDENEVLLLKTLTKAYAKKGEGFGVGGESVAANLTEMAELLVVVQRALPAAVPTSAPKE